MSAKICPKCNTSNPAEANFCRHCGANFRNDMIIAPSSVYLKIKIAEAKEAARMICKIVLGLQNNKLNYIIARLKHHKIH